MFTRHHLRSLSFALLILAGCAGLTAFGATRRADAAPNPVASAQRATAVPPTPQLQRPADNACATGVVTFSWLWKGAPLTSNQGFEVRLWKVGKLQHVRLAIPASPSAQRVDLRLAPVVRQGGSGRYWWSVAMVQISPYQEIGKETSPRQLYIDLTKPANAPCVVPGSPTDTPGGAEVHWGTVFFEDINAPVVNPEVHQNYAFMMIPAIPTAPDTLIDAPTDVP